MYSASLVARYIVNYCNSNGKTISNLRLQKTLYFVQAEFLVSRGTPCFSDEIYAWDLGPVVPEVYREYKIFGSSAIPSIRYFGKKISEEDQEMINNIVDECNKHSSYALVQMTHEQAPWIKAYNSFSNGIITKASIRDYFS